MQRQTKIITMDKAKLEEIGNKVAESDFFKKHGYKSHWISGSTTEVYPIRVWIENNCIEIQLGCNNLRGIKRALDKLVKSLSDVREYYICKYDGSCPDVARIYFK